jgi:hypothetical protein
MAYERRVLAGFFEGDTKRPTGSREKLATYAFGSRRDAADVVAFVASPRDREARVLATPLGPAGRIRVGVVAFRGALLLGDGARPRVGLFVHGLRASRARRFFEDHTKRPAGPRGEAHDVRLWFAPQRSTGRGVRRVDA